MYIIFVLGIFFKAVLILGLGGKLLKRDCEDIKCNSEILNVENAP